MNCRSRIHLLTPQLYAVEIKKALSELSRSMGVGGLVVNSKVLRLTLSLTCYKL